MEKFEISQWFDENGFNRKRLKGFMGSNDYKLDDVAGVLGCAIPTASRKISNKFSFTESEIRQLLSWIKSHDYESKED